MVKEWYQKKLLEMNPVASGFKRCITTSKFAFFVFTVMKWVHSSKWGLAICRQHTNKKGEVVVLVKEIDERDIIYKYSMIQGLCPAVPGNVKKPGWIMKSGPDGG